jgi:hypothetical protein
MTRKWFWQEMWGDTMKAKVNLELLKTTSFDSGSLGMLAMVLHQFSSAGRYHVAIMERGRAVTDVHFEVNEESEVMQLDIDLAQAVRNARARPEDCGCKSKKQATPVVSPKGYVLFHASSGNGYSVTVAGRGDEVVFDSTKLTDGDLFAVSLLEPTSYSMTNTLGSAAGEIVVSLTPEMAKQINALETRYIDVSEQTFDPERIELTSSQGLVFRIKGTARILIQKKDPSPTERVKPLIRWQKLQRSKQ